MSVRKDALFCFVINMWDSLSTTKMAHFELRLIQFYGEISHEWFGAITVFAIGCIFFQLFSIGTKRSQYLVFLQEFSECLKLKKRQLGRKAPNFKCVFSHCPIESDLWLYKSVVRCIELFSIPFSILKKIKCFSVLLHKCYRTYVMLIFWDDTTQENWSVIFF